MIYYIYRLHDIIHYFINVEINNNKDPSRVLQFFLGTPGLHNACLIDKRIMKFIIYITQIV